MTETPSLDIYLHDEPIGRITQLPNNRNLFSFNESYTDQQNRSTLSLSYKDQMGELITSTEQTRTRLSPFFSNLLPEGHMRQDSPKVSY